MRVSITPFYIESIDWHLPQDKGWPFSSCVCDVFLCFAAFPYGVWGQEWNRFLICAFFLTFKQRFVLKLTMLPLYLGSMDTFHKKTYFLKVLLWRCRCLADVFVKGVNAALTSSSTRKLYWNKVLMWKCVEAAFISQQYRHLQQENFIKNNVLLRTV